jgi:hypothetical protein
VTLRAQLDHLRANIVASDARLEAMRGDAIDRGVCPCCVGASYGGLHGPYERLIDRQERRRTWLSIAERKVRESRSTTAAGKEDPGNAT